MTPVGWGREWSAAMSALLLGLLGTAPPVQADEVARVDDSREAAPEPQPPARFFRVTASTGFDFSTGDFGTDTDSEAWYMPTAFKIEWDPIFLKVTGPYVVLDGDVVIIDGQPQGDPAFTGRRDGIGDVVIAVGAGYYPLRGILPAVELSGKVKLGTGEEDYTLQLDVIKQFGPVTPFATVGYRFVGDLPDLDLDDKFFASAGAMLSFASSINSLDGMSVGVVYDWAQSAVPGQPDIQEIVPFAMTKLGDRFAIDRYTVIGFSNSSPDWGVGMQLRVFWERG